MYKVVTTKSENKYTELVYIKKIDSYIEIRECNIYRLLTRSGWYSRKCCFAVFLIEDGRSFIECGQQTLQKDHGLNI